MTFITWACLTCVQELANILGPQNPTQRSCVTYFRFWALMYVHFVGRVQVADTSKEPNLLKHRDVKNAILESAGKKAELGTVPTFPEFVDYVVAETRDLASPRDWKGVMTWKSYYAKCLPCDVRCDEKYLFTKMYLTTKNILQQEN